MAIGFDGSESTELQWSNSETSQEIPNFFSKAILGNTSAILNGARALVVAAIVSSILRVASRRQTNTPFYLDDLCAVVATVFLVANSVIFGEVYFLGISSFGAVGEFSDGDVAKRQKQILAGLKLSLVFEVLYLISISLVKFSMLFLYDRFARQSKGIGKYLRATKIVCAVAFIACIACIISLSLSCIPISNSYSWGIIQEVKCRHRTLLIYISGITDILTNTLVLAVPVPLILRANLTNWEKIRLFSLYFFGAFVILGSALRFATQILIVSVPREMGWSQMEVSLALILASAPMAMKLLAVPLVDPITEREHHMKSNGGILPLSDGGSDGNGKNGTAQSQIDRSLGTENAPLSKRCSSAVWSANETPSGPPMYILGNAPPGGRNSVRAINPDYPKLKVVRDEINGQSIWGVRPMTPMMPKCPENK